MIRWVFLPLCLSVVLSLVYMNSAMLALQPQRLLHAAGAAEAGNTDAEMQVLTDLLKQKRFSELSRILSRGLSRNPGDANLLDIKRKMILADYKNAFVEPVKIFAGTRFEKNPDPGNCKPGVLNTYARERTLNRLIYFRRLAGISDSCVFITSADKECQAAAFMMEVNGSLSHTPSKSWKCYSAEGARAAASSNLSLGYGFEEALTGQVKDNGDGNEAVGHRRWILNPDNSYFGFGSTNEAMCLKVFGSAPMGKQLNRQIADSQFIAWPSADFFPYDLCPQRWSFSLKNADFSAAVISMWVNGKPIQVRKEKVRAGYALNTLVWVPQALIPQGAMCKISLSRVMSAGKMKSYTYSTQLIKD